MIFHFLIFRHFWEIKLFNNWTSFFTRMNSRQEIDLKHPALTSKRNGVRNTQLFSNLPKHFEIFNMFQNVGFSNLEHDFSVIWIVRDQKSILFDIEKFTFRLSINFKNFENFQNSSFFIKNDPKKLFSQKFLYLPEAK